MIDILRFVQNILEFKCRSALLGPSSSLSDKAQLYLSICFLMKRFEVYLDQNQLSQRFLYHHGPNSVSDVPKFDA